MKKKDKVPHQMNTWIYMIKSAPGLSAENGDKRFLLKCIKKEQTDICSREGSAALHLAHTVTAVFAEQML